MTSELAKQLKDAGFPQILARDRVVLSDEGEPVETNGISFLPSLGELIAACGDDFSYLKRITIVRRPHANWQAMPNNSGDAAYGAEADEAVANLWLALNGKHDGS